MSIHYDRKNERWRFQFDRYVEGERHRASRLLPKGWSRTQAQKFDDKETARLAALAAGIEGQQYLIDDAVLVYLEQHAPGLKSFENIRRELHAFSEWYAGRGIEEVPEVAQEYRESAAAVEKPEEMLAPATVRNRLAYLRAACRYAWKHDKRLKGTANPAARMVVPTVNNARHFYWTRAEFLEICRQVPPGQKRAAVRIAFYSGMRVGEVKMAEGSQQLFDLGTSKNGLPRLVPVHPRLAHILRNPDLWPIAYTKWTISKEFKKAARAAGFDDAVLHDMRHSTASEMINGGADLKTVGGVLGHASVTTTERYAHLVTATLTKAVALVGKKSPTRLERKHA